MTAVACRMPQYFDDPDTFKPARFDPENKRYMCIKYSVFLHYHTRCITVSRPSPFVYFPFGVGHRACIGRHFAMVWWAPWFVSPYFWSNVISLYRWKLSWSSADFSKPFLWRFPLTTRFVLWSTPPGNLMTISCALCSPEWSNAVNTILLFLNAYMNMYVRDLGLSLFKAFAVNVL